jgi:hypothetical protein
MTSLEKMTETALGYRSKNFSNELGRIRSLVKPKTWTALYLLLIGLSIGHIVVILRVAEAPLNISDPVYIDIDTYSDLSRDLASIEHNKDDATVTVRFRAGASCPRPFLVGRLSGPALSLIQDWKWQSDDDMTTSLTGSYHVPFPGIYYIEIIAIHCSDFSDIYGMDFKKTCVIDPYRNRLSIQSANISVSQMGSAQGYWISNNTTLSSDQNTNSTMKFPIMYTRFQPPGCMYRPNPGKWRPVQWPTFDQESRCGLPTSMERYMDYHFEYVPSSPMSRLSLADLVQEKFKTICVIGASHARDIAFHMKRLGIHGENVRVLVNHIDVDYPHEVSSDQTRQAIHNANCDILLIAVGQWPASYDGGRPTLIHDYHDQIKDMLQNMTESHPDIQIFMRSIHDNPLNIRTSFCPPKDWRNPTVIDAYNKVIAKVCEQMEHIKFVNTNFVVTPMWDSSPDWCHLSPELQSVESFYLAAVVLGVFEHSQSNSKY